MEKINVAVIGAGHLGRYHAKIYAGLGNARLVSVCDTNKRRAKKIARHHNASFCTDYRQLFNKINAASIAVPTELHFQVAKDLLSNNIHCLIEKPIANKLEQAEELVKIADKNHLVLQVGHIERFNAAIRAIEPLCRNPRFIECHRMGPFKKRALDVGVVLDLMIHDIDIIMFLVKSEVSSIEAVGVQVLTDHEDIANARIKFKNNAIANISASRLSKAEMRKIRIFQPDAYISLDYIKQAAAIFRKTNNRISRNIIRIKPHNALQEELNSFVNCIQNNQCPVVTGKQATEALRVALDITEKIRLSYA